MFGHDDKKDEDGHEGSVATDNDQVVSPDNAGDSGWQHPGPPPVDDTGDNSNQNDASANNFATEHTDEAAHTPDPADDRPDPAPLHTLSTSDDTATSASTGSNDDLIDLKQEALGKLSPLIGHLDQSPDEKFRTLMMMIQASDDQSLIRQAYETALSIDDEKTRAQALLDIVNEINYFTQNPKSE